MSTPDRSGTSRESEGSGEAGTSGAQLVCLEDLQDVVQTLVQRAIADGGSQQAPTVGNGGTQQPAAAGTSGERFRGYIWVAEQLFCSLVVSLGGSRPLTQGRYTWKPLKWPLNLHLFETLYFRSLNDSTKNKWQEKEV